MLKPNYWFEDAKIVEDNHDSRIYHKHEIERGHSDYAMTRSDLMSFNDCPQKWLRGYTREDSDATRFGSLLDCMILDSDRFDSRYSVQPETYLSTDGESKPWNANANICKKWKSDTKAKGLEIATHGSFQVAQEAHKRLKEDREIYAQIVLARHQVLLTATYVGGEIPIPVKCLIDLLWEKEVGDFKTAACASPDIWSKKVHDYNYHVQAAMTLDLLFAADSPRQEFRHIIQESDEPFEIGTRYLTTEFINHGRMKYLRALAKYCECLKTGTWPTYDPCANAFGRWSECAPPVWMKE